MKKKIGKGKKREKCIDLAHIVRMLTMFCVCAREREETNKQTFYTGSRKECAYQETGEQSENNKQ